MVMPTIFEQTLFCAWFGFSLSRMLGAHMDSPENIFMAAMCHDIGMVHIEANLIHKKGQLSPEEWKQIQAHPVIGYNIVKDTKNIDTLVAQAILEHHENIYGTGYPRAIQGSKLGRAGQLLNLLDSCNAIYNKNVKSFNRSLADLIPILQMNQHNPHDAATNQLIVLLRQLPKKTGHSIPSELTTEVISAIKNRNAYVAHCAQIVGDIVNQVSAQDVDISLANIHNAMSHITTAITRSGIINTAYMRWLDQVTAEKLDNALPEIEEAYLIIEETIYHIERVKNQLKGYLEQHQKHAIAPYLNRQITQLEQQHIPEIAHSLTQVWIFKN
jgi:hypothetical protein